MTTQTKAQRSKAIKVAADVLEHIRALNISRGTFIRSSEPVPTARSSKKFAAKLQEKQAHCRTCVLGACLLSTVKYYNKFDFAGANDIDSGLAVNVIVLLDRLVEVFTPEQIILIEQAFEQGEGYFWTEGHDYLGVFARDFLKKHNVVADSEFFNTLANAVAYGKRFGDRFEGHTKRLRAIMKNIIKNNGEFIPPRAKKS